MAKAKRSAETRAKIFRAALARFRKHGLDGTSMRDIAGDAEVAVGAAYYYFPSKNAIVLAYYEETQRLVAEQASAAFAETDDVRERLGVCFHARLDVLSRDRKLLAALFHTIADPHTEVSIFGEGTRSVREDSIALFARAIAPASVTAALDDATRRVLVLALWSLHMGVLLYFVHDRSRGQHKTHALVDHTLDLVCSVLPIAPELAPVFGDRIAAVLREADLL